MTDYVSMDGEGLIPCEIIDGWNGFACPKFSKEELPNAIELVARFWVSEGVDVDSFVKVTDTAVLWRSIECATNCNWDCDDTEIFSIESDGSCFLGAWSWVWHHFTEEELGDVLGQLSDRGLECFEALRREVSHRLQRELSPMDYYAELVTHYGVELYNAQDLEDSCVMSCDMLEHVCECEAQNV